MRKIVTTRQFEKDLKRCLKRGNDARRLKAVVEALQADQPLPDKHVPHPLKGKWKPKWECHIEPDWLLVYEVAEDEVLLVRTGTHSDLF